MHAMIPIPDRKALEAARDLASDIRAIASEMLVEGISIEDYDMKRRQIIDMSELIFYCVETNKKFRVGDYVTPKAELKAINRESKKAEAYRRVFESLRVH